MKEKLPEMTLLHIMCNVAAVLLLAVLYLLYKNFLAEDMIRELNRDLEELYERRERGGLTEHGSCKDN